MQATKSRILAPKDPEETAMKANGGSAKKSVADQRHEEFAKKNKAWDQRVRNAVAELDKVASKAKRAGGSTRRTSA